MFLIMMFMMVGSLRMQATITTLGALPALLRRAAKALIVGLQRIAAMALETPGVTFVACANTQANMSKQENKQITLISEAKVMPSGVVRIMELKEMGYAYLRP